VVGDHDAGEAFFRDGLAHGPGLGGGAEDRAADALAVLFSYGGGNAAIGAWTGRV